MAIFAEVDVPYAAHQGTCVGRRTCASKGTAQRQASRLDAQADADEWCWIGEIPQPPADVL
jgi:hypothetical protein